MDNDYKYKEYISDGMTILFIICFFVFLGLFAVIQAIPFLEYSLEFAMYAIFVAPFFLLPICLWLFMKECILGAFRIMDYRKNKNHFLKCKDISKGKVIKIKSAGIYGPRYSMDKQWQAYYLIVDLNAEKVKSIFFEDNIYKIGQEINVVSYNGRKYVILDAEKEIATD